MSPSSASSQSGRVLVLDGNLLSTLSIVRSLGRQRLAVTVADTAGKTGCIAGRSRYASATAIYADPLRQADAFVADILALIRDGGFDLLIPVTENTALPLAKRRAEIEACCRLALPATASLMAAVDKDRTFQLAALARVPVPSGPTISELTELDALLPDMRYPVVIKPSKSVAEGADSRIKLNVRYAFDATDLREKCAAILRHTPVILQEYFRGDGVGVEVLADHGEIVLAFQHRRLHEFPLTGGGSTLRISETPNPMLLAHAERLIRQLDWHGVAMLEFKYNPASNECRLMEINGRFWGSLPLAVAAGADFPYALYRLLVDGKAPPARDYRVGWLNRKLQEDLYWLIVVLCRRDHSPLIVWPSAGRILADCLAVFSPRHRFDSFAYDDPWPFAVDTWQSIKWLWTMATGFIGERLLLRKFRKARDTGKALAKARRAGRLLFVCYGNINRSMLAEKCLQAMNGDHGTTVDSAGFHPEADRPADPRMVTVAAARGLDLHGWHSKTLTAAQVEKADLILVMETGHYRRLAAEFPGCMRKVFLLGCLAADPVLCPLEIADPYGHEPQVYETCYRQIEHALSGLAGGRQPPA